MNPLDILLNAEDYIQDTNTIGEAIVKIIEDTFDLMNKNQSCLLDKYMKLKTDIVKKQMEKLIYDGFLQMQETEQQLKEVKEELKHSQELGQKMLQEVQMIEFIPYGEKNKIQKSELMKLAKIKNEKVFVQELTKLRKQYIIKTNTTEGGYWRPSSKEELQEFIKKCQSRSYDTSKRIMIAYKELEEMEDKK